jgi:hypothetical protein
LIDHRVDAVVAEPIGEGEHPGLMLRTVVAVADEDPWRPFFRQRAAPSQAGVVKRQAIVPRL